MDNGQYMFTLLHPVHLLLSTSFCLHVGLERNINFVHELRAWNTIPTKNFHHKTIVRKRNVEKVSHELFGIEINVNEGKANYGNNALLHWHLRQGNSAMHKKKIEPSTAWNGFKWQQTESCTKYGASGRPETDEPRYVQTCSLEKSHRVFPNPRIHSRLVRTTTRVEPGLPPNRIYVDRTRFTRICT